LLTISFIDEALLGTYNFKT